MSHYFSEYLGFYFKVHHLNFFGMPPFVGKASFFHLNLSEPLYRTCIAPILTDDIIQNYLLQINEQFA